MLNSGHVELSQAEREEAQKRRSVTVHVVHEAVRKEGAEELKRTPAALAWSASPPGFPWGFR